MSFPFPCGLAEGTIPLITCKRNYSEYESELNAVSTWAVDEEICCLQMPNTILIVTFEGSLYGEIERWRRYPSPKIAPIWSATESLTSHLKSLDHQLPSPPELFQFIQVRLCEQALEDEWRVLSDIQYSLQEVDTTMMKEDWLRNLQPFHQFVLGHWRSHLHSRYILSQQLTEFIKATAISGEDAQHLKTKSTT